MQITGTHKIITSVVAVAVLLGVYIAFDRKFRENNQTNNTLNQISTTTNNTGVGAGLVDTGSVQKRI